MKCVVIGAIINGLSSAIWLQRFGHDVTLVDRAEPGAGTSYGNAGILAAGAVLPVTVPGLIAKIPKMVLSKHSPLFLRWRYLPRLLPFLMKYLSFGTKKHVSRFAQEMSYLLGDSYDQHVFTLGPWVQGISKQLGLSIPFESEGGYHVELINPSHMPKLPVMISAGKFVITPMEGRIRLAGLLEFAGLDAPDNPKAVEYLTRHISKYLPHVRYDDMKVWHGLRPTTANSYPVIGRPAHLSNAYVGFGHQHIGLTAGPKTGRILAEMISNRPVNKDLSVFDPNQYRAMRVEVT